MSNSNQLQYFASQSYRQIQLSVNRGNTPYPYSDFSRQFAKLLDASGDEKYTRQLTTQLIEEAARQGQTFDELRQKMDAAVQQVQLTDQTPTVEPEKTQADADQPNSHYSTVGTVKSEAVLAD